MVHESLGSLQGRGETRELGLHDKALHVRDIKIDINIDRVPLDVYNYVH